MEDDFDVFHNSVLETYPELNSYFKNPIFCSQLNIKFKMSLSNPNESQLYYNMHSDRFKVIAEANPTCLFSIYKVVENKFSTHNGFNELELKKIQKEKNSVFAVTHTYTGYPMVRQMTKMISKGIIGDIQKVDGQYLQGWLNPVIHDKEKRSSTWRLDPEKSGSSCCLGDIGTHAFNMVELVTGMKVTTLLADLNTLYDDNPMDIDANILFRFSNNAKGTIRSSQIATGEENNIRINVYGSKGALKWKQENPNYLYHLTDDNPIQVLKPGHSYNSKISLDGTKLPPGHPEGIFDAMGNIYKGVARAIKSESFDKEEFPSIEDGVRGMDFIEKALESNSKGNIWVELNN